MKKKLFSLVLCLCLFVSLSITALAAPELTTVYPDPAAVGIPASVTVAVYEGKGDTVIPNITLPGGYSYKISATHDGKRNFIVDITYPDSSYDNLYNEIGNYSGTQLINKNPNTLIQNCFISVKADGHWTLAISTVTNSNTACLIGKGDKVSGLFQLPKGNHIVNMTHSGRRNFIVELIYPDGSYDLLANKIGNYSGQELIKLKKNVQAYISVQADGDWVVDLGQGTGASPVADIN